jgi:hypothetical protein
MECLAEQPQTQFYRVTADKAEYLRPPTSEIYGRSLTTIHRLGAYMVGKVASETIHSPEAEQARAEFYTSVEEGFGTDMKLGGGLEVRDFDTRSVINGKVMAKDLKTPVSGMTHAGVICAQEKAETEGANGDYRFLPQLTRSRWDHENALLVDKMAQGETDYNTRIVISPFPEEAAVQSGDAYWRDIGYVPHLKRGFVQLYVMSEEGLIAGSLSFDGSNKERLREIFHRRGVDIPQEEITDNWLQYAITDTLSKDEAKELALEIANEAGDLKYKKTTNTVDMTSEHRLIMDAAFNDSYVHACESLARGRQTPGVRKLIFELADKATDFNGRYASALYGMRANETRFTDDDMVVIHELLVFSTIEMMRAIHLEKTQRSQSSSYINHNEDLGIAHFLATADHESFQKALSSFGAYGAINNRTYSACGLSISLGGEDGTDDSPQSVFGGLSRDKLSSYGNKDDDCEFVSKKCPMCGAKNVKTKVTKTRISGSCGCSKSK